MLHKLTLVLTTAVVLGIAGLVPTSASAWWGGGWGWHGWHRVGWGWGGPHVVVVPGFYGGGWCYWHPYRCGRW
jgi:hypothetical protein